MQSWIKSDAEDSKEYRALSIVLEWVMCNQQLAQATNSSNVNIKPSNISFNIIQYLVNKEQEKEFCTCRMASLSKHAHLSN